MEKSTDYRKIYGCPKHGITRGSRKRWTPGGTKEGIPCFQCDACKRIYLDPINGNVGSKQRTAPNGYLFWNTVGPVPMPKKVFIYSKDTEKGLCECPGKLKKKMKNITHFLMEDGTTKSFGGAKVCTFCNDVFVTLGTYNSQKSFFEQYNIEAIHNYQDLPMEDNKEVSPEAVKDNNVVKKTADFSNGIASNNGFQYSCAGWENELFEIEDTTSSEVYLDALIPASRVASAYYDAKISFNPYQYLPWLKVFINGSNDLLISDEVGLGKTIEAGILIKEQLIENVNSRIVIICPAFLREKWYQELSEKFFLESQIYDGKTIVDVMTNIIILPISRIKQYLENENNYDYSMVVIDEVHYFKNAQSARYGYLRKMLDKIGESKRIFMSATPINNSGNDYHSIESLFLSKSDRTNTTKKQAYIYLPERNIEDVYVELTAEERDFYSATDSLDPFSGTIYRHIGASCLYALGRYAYSGDELTSETKEELRSSFESLLDGRNIEEIEGEHFQKIREMAMPKMDSKIQKLKEILRSYGSDHKIVLFSHYIETVKYLHSELSTEFNTGWE